ncbi:MAG: sensor histidine kinase [Kordiimonadaceae bacterium]|nr:sensor histidine kinase [Kordiimonadaceae bacterium]MBO6569181.1 sensor histidine kinase [Kordiimonadaceae bacterium]MBO6964657.1 sensor histidine kinase [Kordiimonadaceae bacterium]
MTQSGGDINVTANREQPGSISRFLASLAGRLLLSAILWSSVALVVGGVVLSFAFRSYVLSDVDKRLEILLDTLVGISEVSPEGEFRLNQSLADQRFMTPYSGWYWQVSEAGQEPERSRSLWDFALDPGHQNRNFSLRYSITPGPDGQTLRQAEHDIILPEAERVFHYQVATDMAEVQAAIDRFNWLLFSALALILVTVSLALVLQVSYGLRPLRQIKRDLSDVRAGRSAHLRSADEGKMPEDLRPLVDEINGLINQNDKLVDRARTHVGNLAHALKTPLSIIQNEVDGKSDKGAELIARQAKDIRVHVDHHLKRARIAGGGTGPGLEVKTRVEKLVKAVKVIAGDKKLQTNIECLEGVSFDGEKQDFDELLGNIIENAAKWAESKLSINIIRLEEGLRRPMLEIKVEDDGPGVPDEEREALFNRGTRLDEQVPGTGLGLAIVRDIADMYGGSVALSTAGLGGLAVTILLPAK